MENEILKSIKAEMEQKEKEFNQVINELNILEQNYATRKAQLKDAKEQIRGAYTVLYTQLEKFAKDMLPQQEQPAPQEVQEVEETVPEEQTEVVEKHPVHKSASKTTKKVEEVKTTSGLTAEEIAKINKAVPKKNVVDMNGNEVPEYLQSEYNK